MKFKFILLAILICISGNFAIAQEIFTIAGNGTAGFSGNGTPASTAILNNPNDLIFDGAGNLIIADRENNMIRKISPSGIITTVAGNGTAGFAGDGGPATASGVELFEPTHIAFDASGNLYIAELSNHIIRKINTAGIISTVAGTPGVSGFAGNGGPATAALLNQPEGIAFDPSGNMYVAEFSNNIIRKISTTGIISTAAGNLAAGYGGDNGPATASTVAFSDPNGLLSDAAGNLYIADEGNYRVRKINTSGVITTIAGSGVVGYGGDGQPATAASVEFTEPYGLQFDAAGNLYIADLGNNVIRKVNTSGIISTVSGNGTAGFAGDGGAATSSAVEFNAPRKAIVDANGSMFIADLGNNRIREISCPVANAGPAQSVCAGSVINLTGARITGATTSTWSAPSGSFSNPGSLTSTYTPSIASGTVTLTLTTNNPTGAPCSGGVSTKVVTVNPLPGIISGATTIYTTETTTLTSTSTGGVWSSTNNAAVAVGPAGIITGEGAGTATISYTLSTGCGAATTTVRDTTATPAGALNFDGANDRIDGTNANLPQGDADRTAEAWINLASYTSDFQTIYTWGNFTPGQRTGLLVHNSNLYYVGEGNDIDATSVTVPLNTWTHVAFTLTGRTVQFYVNGNLMETSTVANVPNTTGTEWSISNTSGDALLREPIHGSMDEVRVWNRVLCQGEIANSMNCELAGTESGLVAYYKFNEGLIGADNSAVNTLTDLTNPSGAGTLTNFTLNGTASNWVAGHITGSCSTWVPPTASITPGGPTTFCAGGSVVLSANSGAGLSYQWTNGGVNIDGANSLTYTATTSGIYAVVVTEDGNCTATSAGVTVSVNPLPTTTYSVTGGGSYCAGGTGVHVGLSNSDNGVNYQLLIGGTATGSAMPGTGASLDFGLQTTAGTYTVSAQNATTACTVNMSGSAAVSVNALPAVTASSSTSVCAGSSVTLSGGGAVSYSWTGGAINGVPFTPIGTTTYMVTGTDVNSCTNTATTTVTVNPKPAAIGGGVTAVINTIAGTGTAGYSGDGGPATAATFNLHWGGLAYDATGNLYVADGNNNAIRKISTSGTITTIAGTGATGFSGDGGPATAAEFNNPIGLTFDASGNLYVGDFFNSRIRKINTSGTITTIAGTGTSGYNGDNQPATAAELDDADKVAFDGSGNTYVIDCDNNRVRKIDASGIITTVAGTGTRGYTGDDGLATAAELSHPSGLLFDAAGNMYIADEFNNRIRKVNSAGIITTIGGTGAAGFFGDGGPATAAHLFDPTDMSFDNAGDIIFADASNNVLRMINTAGIITTLAGNGVAGYGGDGGPATAAELNAVNGLAFDGNSGNLALTDDNNNRVRYINLSATVCVGASVTLTSATSGGTWSSNSGGVAVIDAASGVATGVSAGATEITYMLGSGCYTTTNITVNALPAVSAGANAAICSGGSATLSGSGAGTGGTYTWSPSAGLSSTTGASPTAALTATVITAYVYTVTGTNAHGCRNTATETVSVNPLPTAGISYTGNPFCTSAGSTSGVTQTGTGVGTYSATGGLSVNSSTGAIDLTSAASGTVTFNYANADGSCPGSTSAGATINPNPVLSASATNATCNGGSDGAATVSVTDAAGVASYNWTPAGGSSATASGLTAGVYAVTVTDANTCTATATATVGAGALPLAIIDPSNPTTCSNVPVTLNANAGSAGNALSFSGINPSYATIPGVPASLLSSNFTVSTWINTGSAEQQNILFHGLGCSYWASWYLGIGSAEPNGPVFPGKIVFGFGNTNAPANNIVTATSTVTTNTWIQVTVTYDGSNLKLYLNGVLNNTVAASGIPWNAAPNLYVGQDPGCGGRLPYDGKVDELQVWNVTRSAADIAANYNQLISPSAPGLTGYWRFDEANGNTVYDVTSNANDGTLSGSAARLIPSDAPINGANNTGVSYVWAPVTGLTPATGATVSANPATTTRYVVTATNTAGCTNQSDVTINVNPAPTVSAGSDVTICFGTSATLTATGADTYSWTVTPGLSCYDCASPSANPTATTTYTVTGTNAETGCQNTASVTVNVNALPTISCAGPVTQSNDAAACGAVVNYTAATATGIPTPVITYSQDAGTSFPVGVTTVTATATNTCGAPTCSFTVTVNDTQAPTITAPAAVTVNANPGVCSATGYTLGTPVVNDNCGVDHFSSDDAGSYPVGTSTITWTVTDVHGLTATATQNITVTDNQPPVISVSNVSVNNDAGTCGAVVPLSATATDNCGVGAPASDWVGGPFPVGTTTVNWSVTDIHGNTGTAVQTVTVTDNQAPVISVSNVSVNNDPNTCGAAVTLSATATDNCGVGTPTNDWVGGPFPVGTTTVNWSVTDIHGNTATATQTVTVTDNQPPVISVSNVSVNNDPTTCGAVVALSAAATDNCGVGTPANDWTGGAFPVGTTTVHWSVTDIHGNTATATQTVTVTDNEAPSITPPANITVCNLPAVCNAIILYLGTPTTHDNCGVASVTNDHPGIIYPVGTTTVTWTVRDIHGNTTTATQTVTVNDCEHPTILAMPFNITVWNTPGACSGTVSYLGLPLVFDNCGIASITNDHSTSTTYPVGTTTVTWTITDIHGNTTTATQNVTVIDNQNPTIATDANVTVNAATGLCSATVTLPTPAAADNCAVATVVSSHSSTTYPVGTTTVTWTVTDIHGNTATSTQTVTVIDNQPPTIVAPASVTVNATAGLCSATVSLSTPATADNCGVASVASNHSSTSYPVGTTTVTWTVTDMHGNTATATQNVTVVDNQPPTITAPANVSVSNTAGLCSGTASLGTPVTHDNCGVATVTNNAPATYPVGTTTVTWTVTDIHGNTATATQTVTVTDHEAPHAICHSYTLVLSGGSGTLTAANVDGGSYDNCGIASMTVSPSKFTCANAGSNTVTLTVTDVHGNVSTCSSVVTVEYAPTCSISTTPCNTVYTGGVPTTIYLGYGPQSATLTATATGGSGFTYSWTSTSGTGNLSNTHIANPVFTASLPGRYTYVVTITNQNGCSTTCSVTICVIDAVDHKTSGHVLLCHAYGCTPETISCTPAQVLTHLPSHCPSDHLGPVGSTCTTSGREDGDDDEKPVVISELTVNAFPNPYTNEVHVKAESNVMDNVNVTVYDITGRVIDNRPNQQIGSDIVLGQNLTPGIYIIEVKQGEASRKVKVVKY